MIDVAADEAVRSPSIKILVVVGFAYEADARVNQKRGRITIYPVQARQDLRIRELDDVDQQAFTIVAEPDISILEVPDTRRHDSGAGERLRHLQPRERKPTGWYSERHSLLDVGHGVRRLRVSRTKDPLPRWG